MVKTYPFKIVLLCFLFCLAFTRSAAQYAIGGSAGTTLVNSVYWLTWDPTATGTTMISSPAGADASHIINGTYVWQFSPSVRITAVLSNEVTTTGTPMIAYTPGQYSGDGLDLIYSGNNQPKPASRGVSNSALATPYGATVTFDIDVKVAILINNVWTDVVYPGMVVGDAESIDSGGEFISGDTPNPIAWQLLNKRTQNDPADSHYKMDLSNAGRSFKLYADLPPGNFGVQAVMFAHGARNITNLSMKGSGIQAIAIGFVLPFDLTDAPASYQDAGHYMENFQITDYYAGDGTYSVVNYNTTPLVPYASVYIGDSNVDPDGQPAYTVNANNDDGVGADDENTLSPSSLPDIKVNMGGNIVINLPVTNTKGVPATLYGWIDFNNDGIFAPNELISVTVPANTNNQSFPLIFPNAMFAGKLKVGTIYARFRITTTQLLDDNSTPFDERSTSFAADGEVEDYRFKNTVGITITGSLVDDPNGPLDGAISGNPVQTVSGKPLFAYLIDNNTNLVSNKVLIGAGGTYTFININNGNYTVAISTNNVAIGSNISAVSANLPAGWVASGGAYGVNNAANTGLQSGTPNLQILVSTPGTGLDVTNVNLSVNQVPVAADDLTASYIGVPFVLNVLANDSDADGTKDQTSVLLIDPVDNLKKTSVTLAGQGTYTVNTTTGAVTFTPVATFTGKAIINYTFKDNFGSESLPASISVWVKPVGVNDTDVTAVSTAVTTTVKANDGPSGNNNTVTATAGSHGVTAVDAAGNVTYTPVAGYLGTDTYTYTLTTPDGVISDPITVTINIGPGGVNDAAITPINTPVTTNVKANDGPSSVGATVAAANGSHGTTVVDGSGNVTYTPTADYIGKDTYTYTFTNGRITSAPITVTVSIKPVGVNDVNATPINTPVTSTVKTNDGPSGIGTTVAPTNGAHGTTTVDAGGKVTYTPTTGYTGTDVYTYTLTTPDGVVSDPITVTITIYASSMTLTKVANNGGTNIGDVINYTLVVTNTGSYAINNVIVADPGTDAGSISPAVVPSIAAGASVTVTAKHTLTQADFLNGSYSNQASVSGTDQNGVLVARPKSDNPATPAPDDPTVVTLTPLPGAVSLSKSGIFTGNYINYTFYIKNTGQSIINSISLSDAKLGLTNFAIAVPVGGLYPGAAVFFSTQYTLTQADKDAGVVNNTATVSCVDGGGKTITSSSSVAVPVAPSPVAVDDATTTTINTPVIIPVLANDNPGNSTLDPKTVEIVGQPANGTVTVNADGTITYTPNPGYNGPDKFTYRVKDAYGYYTNVATVTITQTLAAGALKVPNLFTPNGDGVNDVFEIRGLDQYQSNELSIVNRWGNEVYHSSHYTNTWTGDGLNEGTYYYTLKVKRTAASDAEIYKGYVTLMRSF